MILTAGQLPAMRSANSIPFMPGIMTSEMTASMSGWAASMSRAAAPE